MNGVSSERLAKEIGATITGIPPFYYEKRSGLEGEIEVVLTVVLDLDFGSQIMDGYSVTTQVGIYFYKTMRATQTINETKHIRVEELRINPIPEETKRDEIFAIAQKEVETRIMKIVDRLISYLVSRGESQ